MVNIRFHRLPLPVQIAQSLGDFRCPLRVIGEEQLQRKVDLPHPPRRVDAGCQHEADGGGIDSFGVAAAFRHQGGDAGPLGMGERVEAPGGKDPVFAL